MTVPFSCSRCGAAGPRLERAPLRGSLGQEILERVCGTCWQAWQNTEVMVINELRLNFMDPAAIDIPTAHMKEFLGLAPTKAS